jgi:hypothetical protein
MATTKVFILTDGNKEFHIADNKAGVLNVIHEVFGRELKKGKYFKGYTVYLMEYAAGKKANAKVYKEWQFIMDYTLVKDGPNKGGFFMTDNVFDIYAGGAGGWYMDKPTLAEELEAAPMYIGFRTMSGVITKKTYILSIRQRPGGPMVNREWAVALNIKRIK